MLKDKVLDLLNNENFTLKQLSTNGKIETHSINVAILSVKIAKYCDLDKSQIELIVLGSLLHDIGKVCLPQEILNKSGKLNRQERTIINVHAYNGEEMLNNLNLPKEVLDMVKYHHEYIKALTKPIIIKDVAKVYKTIYPLICSIADITDAVVSERSYKLCMDPKVSRNDLYHYGILDIDEIYKTIGIFNNENKSKSSNETHKYAYKIN